MGDALALAAAVVSAAAAVVGALVSLAQLRAARDPAPPPVRQERGPRSPDDEVATELRATPCPAALERRSRATVLALFFATASCLFTAISTYSYWRQQGGSGMDLEAVTDTGLVLGVIASLLGGLFALWALAWGIAHGSSRTVRLAILALVGCSSPWVSFWIIDLIQDRT
jgi:hypothetical protein